MWQDWHNGEKGKIQDYIGYGTGLGITDYILFGCWGNTNWLPIRASGDPYSSLVDLDDYANSQGARLFPVIFTDQVSGPVVMSKQEQNSHLINTIFAMKVNQTCRIEFVNEYGPNKNWPEPMPIPYSPNLFQGLVADWSTWFDGRDPQEPGPYLSFANKHTGGFDQEWSRKSKVCVEGQTGQGGGLGQYPPVRKPVIVRERCRIAEGSFPHEHESSTAIEEAMGGGGNIHGGFEYERGHDSLLQRCYIPTRQSAIDCITAAVSVYDKIPADLSNHGEYRNAGGGVVLHDDNLMLRTYVMMENNNSAWVIRVKGHKPGMALTTINDWRIISIQGDYGTVVHCTR